MFDVVGTSYNNYKNLVINYCQIWHSVLYRNLSIAEQIYTNRPPVPPVYTLKRHFKSHQPVYLKFGTNCSEIEIEVSPCYCPFKNLAHLHT